MYIFRKHELKFEYYLLFVLLTIDVDGESIEVCFFSLFPLSSASAGSPMLEINFI